MLVGEGWDAPAVERVEAVARLLPATLREPKVRLHSAPAQPPDPEEPHRLGRSTRRTVTLYDQGLPEVLEERLGAAFPELSTQNSAVAADFLLRRALVHELVHVVDRALHLSKDPAWRGISGWSPLSLFPSPADTRLQGDFASPYGARSPAEDLATFAEVYFIPPALGPMDADRHPRCRFPQKYRYLSERLGPAPPDPLPVECSSSADLGLDPSKVRSVEILWATPTLASPASVAGHLLVMVESEGPAGPVRRSYGLVADARGSDSKSLLYLVFGVTGGFFSMVAEEPYEITVQRYLRGEDRDLLRFRWVLSEAKTRALLERLDEMIQHWNRPYYFFQRNCSELILELARAIGEPLRSPPVTPPDLVLAELARRGMLEPGEANLSSVTLALSLRGERAAAGSTLCGADYRVEQPEPADRDPVYAAMAARARALDEPACWDALARFIAYSDPLEQAARINAVLAGEPLSMPGYDGALLAVRERVPIERRLALSREVKEQANGAFLAETPRGAGTYHTPYVPLRVGGGVYGFEGQAIPMINLSRRVLDVYPGQARSFQPASGLELYVLDGQLRFNPKDPRQFVIDYQLAELRVWRQRLVSGPTPGFGLELLHPRVSTPAQRWELRWLGVDAQLALGGSWRNHLDLGAGLALESAGALGRGSQTTQHRVLAPVGPKLTLQSAGAHPATLLAEGKLLGLWWGQAGARLEMEASARIYLGDLRQAGLYLDAGARARLPLVTPPGWVEPAEGWAGLGLALERY